MTVQPFVHSIRPPDFIPETFDNHIVRRLSDMRGQFADEAAYERLAGGGDPVLYEVYEFLTPAVAGELLSGISILHSGVVGEEYFMTKGHFHEVLDTAEIYHCLSGRGVMMMETPEGRSAAVDLVPGTILYVPPRWAHRSVNVAGDSDLITFFAYPAHAGHDYATIESRGFRKLVLQGDRAPRTVDNPRWKE